MWLRVETWFGKRVLTFLPLWISERAREGYKKREEFVVHRDLLCATSSIFAAAFIGNFQEGHKGEMIMTEDSCVFVQDFIAYCYKGYETKTMEERDANKLIEAYIFGDKYGCNDFKNLSMDVLQNSLQAGHNLLANDSILEILDNTGSSKTAPIRKFCAALMFYDVTYDVRSRASSLQDYRDLCMKCPDLLLE